MASHAKRLSAIILAALLTAAFIALWFSSASTRPYYGEPISSVTEPAPPTSNRAPELLVLLGFSGGGTRAAALAYGVLQEMANITIATSAGPRRLLDEIDIISSVSGGSFTNAYFALHGDGIFDGFRDAMLLRPIGSDLAKALFDPRNWRDIASPYYGRSDLAAAYYDKYIFGSKTFADIPATAPLTIINASELGTGHRIIFTPHLFEVMCLDLGSYPIARAVAASSAVPGAATPIVIRNHAGSCGPTPPPWLRSEIEANDDSVQTVKLHKYLSLLSAEKWPWLHLVDGGITDNLGLRQYYEFMHLRDILDNMVGYENADDIQEVLLISVNAAVNHTNDWADTALSPSNGEALAAMTHIEMRNYTADTIQFVTNAYHTWLSNKAKENKAARFNFTEVTFANLTDPEEQARMNALPTSMQLKEDQVDALIEVGGRLLRESPHFKDFLARHQATSGQ